MQRIFLASLAAALAACSPSPPPGPTTVPIPPVSTATPAHSTSGAAPTASATATATATAAVAEVPKHPNPCPTGSAAPSTTPWGVLVQPKGCSVLYNFNMRTANLDDVIAVETYDVHKVADASVARLRYTRYDPKDKQDVGERDLLPLLVAVSAKGLYVLDSKFNDAAILLALKKPPTYTEAPKTVKASKASGYNYVGTAKAPRGPMVCFGYAHPRDGSCEDTCTGEVCLSSTAGVVSLEGTASPNFEFFAQDGFSSRN